MSGRTVGAALDRVREDAPRLRSITVEHGTEFQSRALQAWAYRRGVQLDFIRPGKPVGNAFIESFNGRLRDECLDVEPFASIADAQAKIEAWRVCGRSKTLPFLVESCLVTGPTSPLAESTFQVST